MSPLIILRKSTHIYTNLLHIALEGFRIRRTESWLNKMQMGMRFHTWLLMQLWDSAMQLLHISIQPITAFFFFFYNVLYCTTTDKAGKSFLSTTTHEGMSLGDRSIQSCNMLIFGIVTFWLISQRHPAVDHQPAVEPLAGAGWTAGLGGE